MSTIKERLQQQQTQQGTAANTQQDIWLQQDQQYCARFDNPWTYFERPPVFERGSGIHLYDVDGKEYLDMVAGFGVVNFGHANPDFVAAAVDQMQKLAQTNNMITPNRIALARRLSEIAPTNGPSRVFFDLGGTASTELARKATNAYTGRRKFISFRHGYHGRSTGALSLIDAGTYRQSFHVPDNAVIAPYPIANGNLGGRRGAAQEALEELTQIVHEHHDEIGGIIVEPVLGSSGYYFPHASFYQGIRNICDEHDFVFVDDEIQMGLGRTGVMFCCEEYGVRPDIILLSKSLGGGGIWPLSASIIRSDICDKLPAKSHTSTFCGNPLGTGLGLFTLDYIVKNRILDHVNERGRDFEAALERLNEDSAHITYFEGRGLAWAVELVDAAGKPSAEDTRRFQQAALENGLFLQRSGIAKNRIIFSPPLTITADEILEFEERFRKTVRDTWQD